MRSHRTLWAQPLRSHTPLNLFSPPCFLPPLQSLIAGFVVEYGSTQVDLSVRGQIEKVAEQLTTQMTAKLA